MKILIGSAWPYANGSLHIGHLAGLLPADVIARYYRLRGDSVYFVSGSDCHGTPVALRARLDNKSPEEISGYYHEEFRDCFDRLGFSYDRYGRTSSSEHIEFVRDFHRRMYAGEYIYEREAPQAFCEVCVSALADRFVVGECPSCGSRSRGDQCDECGAVLDPEDVVAPACSVCGGAVTFRRTRQLYIAISKLERELTCYLEAHPHWRKNAVTFTRRYIGEGLRDRAITRDLDWGIEVPKCGYEDKRIYIWAENVLGYLSMSAAVAAERGEDYDGLWGEDSRHYYVHGKDNIPFHTIVLPSLMLAHGGGWKLPDEIISSEYLTLEGRKISTSQNWAIWVKDIVDRYHPDSIRYFLLANGPEKRDADFSWREFYNSHNGELLGAYGNFVNRTLAFIFRYMGAAVPGGAPNAEIGGRLDALFGEVGGLIERGSIKAALDSAFEFVRYGNKFFDAERPWETRKSDAERCRDTIYNCVQMIAGLAVLLEPFLPFSSLQIRGWLNLSGGWARVGVPAGYRIAEPEILFERLDMARAGEELERLARM